MSYWAIISWDHIELYDIYMIFIWMHNKYMADGIQNLSAYRVPGAKMIILPRDLQGEEEEWPFWSAWWSRIWAWWGCSCSGWSSGSTGLLYQEDGNVKGMLVDDAVEDKCCGGQWKCVSSNSRIKCGYSKIMISLLTSYMIMAFYMDRNHTLPQTCIIAVPWKGTEDSAGSRDWREWMSGMWRT